MTPLMPKAGLRWRKLLVNMALNVTDPFDYGCEQFSAHDALYYSLVLPRDIIWL